MATDTLIIPCEECICLALCRHKTFGEMTDDCQIITRFVYMREPTGDQEFGTDHLSLTYSERITNLWRTTRASKWGVINGKRSTKPYCI